MNKSQEQLLELVRCSLWGRTPNQELFNEGADWSEIISIAGKQTVICPLYTQLEQLPLAILPDRSRMIRLHSFVTRNRKMHSHQLVVLDKITKRLQAIGIKRPVVLKGLGVSNNYLDPSSRQCGDIDLYVGDSQYIEACREAKSWSESVTEEDNFSRKHYEFIFDGVPIEIHRIAIQNNNIPKNSSKFSKWCVEQLEGDEVRHKVIEGVDVYLPPYNFDALYVFFHAWNHFCSYGISFRHICDWCRILSVSSDKIDREELAKKLKEFGLIRPWGFFANIGVKFLDLDPALVVAFDPSANWETKKIADRIWHGGNFGFYSDQHSGKENHILVRKVVNGLSIFHSFGFLFSIDPLYSINFILKAPIATITLNIQQLFYNLRFK